MEGQSIQNWLCEKFKILDYKDPVEAILVLQQVLAHQLKVNRTYLILHPEETIPAESLIHLEAYFNQLQMGYPVPYIVQRQEFFGNPFIVSPDTLIPRPETELIVEEALKWLRSFKDQHPIAYIDVGTGTGCIPISILSILPNLTALASDISFQALKIAKQNSEHLQVRQRIHFINADLLTFASQTWDLVTANLPYIPTYKLKGLDVSKYEPASALDGGEDGLRLIKLLLAELRSKLKKGGLALLEFELDQNEIVEQLAVNQFADGKITILKDFAGISRILRIERI